MSSLLRYCMYVARSSVQTNDVKSLSHSYAGIIRIRLRVGIHNSLSASLLAPPSYAVGEYIAIISKFIKITIPFCTFIKIYELFYLLVNRLSKDVYVEG